MKILDYILGGRPMTKLDKVGFVDNISGIKINFYKDKFGREFMAQSPWSIFRVEVKT